MNQTACLIPTLSMGIRILTLNSSFLLNWTWDWKISTTCVCSIVTLIRYHKGLRINGVVILHARKLTQKLEIKLRILTMYSPNIFKGLNRVLASHTLMITLISMMKFIITERGLYSTFILSLSIRLSEIKHQSSQLKTANLSTFYIKTMKVW